MKFIDILILAAVALIAAGAIWFLKRQKGGCHKGESGCSKCTGCPYCSSCQSSSKNSETSGDK